MFHGPMFLQIFAMQFTATSSCVLMLELHSETQGYMGAMAIAAATVRGLPIFVFLVHRTWRLKHTLTLLANGEIDIKIVIEDKDTLSHKCKHMPKKKAMWKLKRLNSPAQPFSDALWGQATCKYMLLLGTVPPKAMSTIIHNAKLVMDSLKVKMLKAMPVPSVSEHLFSECAKLAFH